MPSSYSARARYTLQAPGENNNTWGTILNNGCFQLVDDSIFGTVQITVSGPVTLSANNGMTDQSRMAILQCSGTGGTITTPGVQNRFLIDARAMTGAVVVSTGGGANATVEVGNVLEVYSPDGVGWYIGRDYAGLAATLASAKAYTDNKMVSGTTLPGSSQPMAVVYTDPNTGNAIWHVLVPNDIPGLQAQYNAFTQSVNQTLTTYNQQAAALAIAFAVSL